MSAMLDGLGLAERDVARVLDGLATRNRTLAVAESLTGGLVCAALTCVPGSSAVIRGGFVVYATELKAGLAGVDPELLAEHGAVHPVVAEQLASGAAERCGADYGIGLTGVAGPSGQDGAEPGTVYIGIAGAYGPVSGEYHFSGGRESVRAGAVRAVIERLAGILEGRTEGTIGRG